MTRDQIEEIVVRAWRRRGQPTASPSAEDWARFEERWGCRFPAEFRHLQELMSLYWFEGDYLRIAPHANDTTVAAACEAEAASGRDWDADLIPFYDVGNGDLVCLRASQCPRSPVYYIYHEDDAVEEVAGSLEAWLRDPEWFP
jgi:hypothetical protein